MFKMKRRKYGGALALALAAMMTLATVIPAWAATVPTTLSGDNVQAVTSSDTTRGGDSATTSSTITEDNSVIVSLQVPTSYTISIPKETLLKSGGNTPTSMVYAAKALTASLDVKCTGVIGNEQKITVTLPASFDVKNRNGVGGAATRACSSTLAVGASLPDSVKGSRSDNTITIEAKNTSSNPSLSDTTIATCAIENTDAIGAGHWAGTLDFTIAVTEEADGSR